MPRCFVQGTISNVKETCGSGNIIWSRPKFESKGHCINCNDILLHFFVSQSTSCCGRDFKMQLELQFWSRILALFKMLVKERELDNQTKDEILSFIIQTRNSFLLTNSNCTEEQEFFNSTFCLFLLIILLMLFWRTDCFFILYHG